MVARKKSKIDCLFVHVPSMTMAPDTAEYVFFVNCIAMGVFSLCNQLNDNNLTPHIVHLGVEKAINPDFSIIEYIRKNKVKIIGLSLHWYYQTYDTLLVVQQIKRLLPDTFIFLGGITSSAFAEDILKEYPEVNAVIKGEGENTIAEMVKRVSEGNYDLSKIPNLYWKDKKKKIHKNKAVWFANEEELNSFNFDGLEYLENYQNYLRMPIYYKNNFRERQKLSEAGTPKVLVCCLGRGCPGNCTWCGGGFEAIKIITGRDKITVRDPKVSAKELIHLKRKYDIDVFYFCYDPYPHNQKFLLELFEILGKEMPKKINIFFECFGLPSKDFVDSFKKNLGDDSEIILSPEFGDDKMRFQHKAFPFSNAELFGCIEYIIRQQIFLTVYFTSLPFESQESIATTLRMVNMLRKTHSKNIKVSYQEIKNCEPYTPWARHPELYGDTIKLKTLDDYVKKTKRRPDFL